MFHRNILISGVTVLSVLAASVLSPADVSVQAVVTIEDRIERAIGVEGVDYASGEVIVTLSAPNKSDNELISEGDLESDGDIIVEDVMNFGDSEDIADTETRREEYADETLYISVVSSDEYSTDELMEKLAENEDVLSVAPNYRNKKMTNDSLFSSQWALGGDKFLSGSGTPASIGYYDETQMSDSVPSVVAVVDDGIDYTHEDLASVMWTNPYPDSKLAGEHGYDFISGDTDPIPDKTIDTHGTHVAGIISAATNNNIGIAGTSAFTELMACKVFDTGEENDGEDSVILQAYEYIYKAQQLGVNISAVNCSFGASAPTNEYTESASERNAFNTAIKKIGSMGALVIFSAGNEGTDVTKYNKGLPYFLDRDYVVIVGSSKPNGDMSVFSNYGKNEVDLMAPGSQILSTVVSDTFLPSSYSQEKRDELCLMYEDFDNGVSGVYTTRDLFGTPSALSILKGDYDFFGSRDGGSLEAKINYMRTVSSTAGTFYIDVTDLGLDLGKNTYYLSYDVALDDEGNGDWAHESEKLQRTSIYGIGGRTYLKFVIPAFLGATISRLGGHSVYFDNIAISKANPDVSQFGRYDYMMGTSMAAPYVSGAVARLAAAYPNDNAITRKAKLLESVEVKSSLKNACATSGILNVSRFEDEDVGDINYNDRSYKVTKVKLNKTSIKLKAGKKLTLKATVSPSYALNKKLKWTVSKKSYATVTQKGVVTAKKKGIGHTVKVTAKATDGSGKKAVCKIKIIR